ncbi:MAG: hypothetical protein Q8M20_16105 [Rhodocyclaceae bacterium]|nr:hypothetical protein [Rhodocyclaceae bacterium]MDZ4215273.1 hypothetical protein [Rhodocyclaceae bacterium]
MLYTFLGGPGGLLARVFGHSLFVTTAGWERVHFGLPMALVLAFPSLMVLAIIEKWLHPVGLLDIAVVQGVGLVMILAWLKHHRVPKRIATVGEAEGLAIPSPCPVSDVLAVPPAPTFFTRLEPPVQMALPQPAVVAVSPNECLLRWLNRRYQWDCIGSARTFEELRQAPPAAQLMPHHLAFWGAQRYASLRGVLEASLTALRANKGVPELQSSAEDFFPDEEDYLDDVLRRLVCSVYFSHEPLFLDQNDLELCGMENVRIMYRLALWAVRNGPENLPLPQAHAQQLH